MCGLVRRGKGEIGHGLGRAFRGRGRASEAARQLASFALDEVGPDRGIALTLASSRTSQRALERAGLRRVGGEPAEAMWAGQTAVRYAFDRADRP